jgi:hypothetical protein
MKPSSATWYHTPATDEPYARSEFIYSGAMSATDAAQVVAALNRTDPQIKATSHTGPNYGGFHQVDIGDSAAFRRAFADIAVLLSSKPDRIEADSTMSGEAPAVYPNRNALEAALAKFMVEHDERNGYLLTVKPDSLKVGNKERLVKDVVDLMPTTERVALSSQGIVKVPVPDSGLRAILEAQVQQQRCKLK